MSDILKEEIDIEDVGSWGVQAHGAFLAIEPTSFSFQGTVVVDVENNVDGSCAGIGVTQDGKEVQFFKMLPPDAFANSQLVGHNIKYDVQMLRKWGFNVSPDQIVWDTQVAEYVKDSTTNTYGLKDLAKQRYGAIWPDYKTLCGTGKKAVSIGTLPTHVVANYNGCDVLFTWKLYQDQLAEMTETETEYFQQIELPTLKVLLEMEERGVEIDAKYIRSLDAGFGVEIVNVVDGIRRIAGTEINLNSHQQIKRLLMEKVGLKLPSTAAEELAKHEEIPLVKDILRYRKLTKLKGTYTGPLLVRSQGLDSFRLKTNFNQTIVHTGRLSSSNPNMQNIPARSEEGAAIRKGIVARLKHKLMVVDYSQIQPSLMAHYSGDPRMLEIFHSEESIYKLVINICDLTNRFSTPQEAKAIAKILWLALAFNAGPFQLSLQTGLTFQECQNFIHQMEDNLETFFYWKNKTIRKTEIDGFVTTLFGRKIPIKPEWAHLGPNYIIQGGESEIVKLAQIATRYLPSVLAVHDEVVFEIPEVEISQREQEVREIMSNIVNLTVPLRVEIGVANNWQEAKN